MQTIIRKTIYRVTTILLLFFVAIPAISQEMRVIDLGTLGGPESKALDVNNRGLVVGKSFAPDGKKQAFIVIPKDVDGDGNPDIWFEDLNEDGYNDLMINLTPGETDCRALLLNEPGQVLIRKYAPGLLNYLSFFVITPLDDNGDGDPDTWFLNDGYGGNALLTEIPTLGGRYFDAGAINNLGQVVGVSENAAYELRPSLWSASTGTLDLGTICPGQPGYATNINDKGEIVGYWQAGYTVSLGKAFRITPVDSNGDGDPDTWVKDSNGDGLNDLMTGLQSLGGPVVESWDINNQGLVVGFAEDPLRTLFPALWDKTGQIRILGDVGGGWHHAYKINDQGQVIGAGWKISPVEEEDPLFWSEESGLQILENTGFDDTAAFDINSLGQVVCSDDPFSLPLKREILKLGEYTHAYLWSEGSGRIDIVGLDGITDKCHPVAINDRGLIVGSSASTSYLSDERAALWILSNTVPGTDVPVTPADPVSGESPVNLIFNEVIEGGDTTLHILQTGTPPPNGLKLGNPPCYYVIETTASYTGPILVCIDYSGISYRNEANLKLFHNGAGGWEDITVSIDVDNDIICGQVISLSEFALFEPAIEADGFQWPLAGLVPAGQDVPLPDVAFKQGRTLPLKMQLLSGGKVLTDADVLPPKIVALSRSSNAIPMDTLDLDAGNANDSGLFFRFSDGVWIYNLSTKELISGTYSITLELPDGSLVCTGFVLR